ncbi:Protein UPSTREAM OF FLC [Camellia lanceoleosa]|uniref:Protein UPSTREAM OF FLC n=1 Tax=Camellia lanceoleosa TaxID=1840588 RepID=A0ACC0F7G0_9ERIC|nr:Protein UPSTREAM OF FLC [Camellia lanceoleosa]
MEGRVKKFRQVSPERAKVWTERSPKYQQIRKVPVVYYLCRNQQLEHPHFIEVPLSSPDGLYLKDMIDRLNVLRGKGMASISYKNGFVWHDLSEDDLIFPAHGSEYVLKGSELFQECNSGRFSPAGNVKLQNPKQLPKPASSRSHDDSSSSSSMNGRETKHSQDDDLSPPVRRSGSSGVSPESRDGKSSPWNGALSLTEYKVYKCDAGLAKLETCTRGVSTDDGSSEPERNESCQNHVPCVKETSNFPRDSISPPASSSSASSSGEKTETLENLIRADASKINSFRITEEEEYPMPSSSKLKASNMLMQLISWFSHSKFPSPLFSTSLILGEFNCLTENPRLMGLRLEDKEYFSGSLVETNMLKEGDGFTALKRSSSYNADRSCNQLDSAADKEQTTSACAQCIPRVIKASLSKQLRSESMKSPVSEGPRISSDGVDSSRSIAPGISGGSSRRITEPLLGKKQLKKLDSFREEKGKVIKIEESLLQELGL